MLSVNRLIKVSVSVGARPAVGRSFNTLMIAGDSNVISGAERFRSYADIESVASDFGVSAPEYLAAALYFEQSPQPTSLMIGRWLASATSGFNLGEILTPAQQLISAWTGITTGAFKISIDGGALTAVSSLDFSTVTNLNGIATLISAALTTASLAATCVWTGESFKIISNSTGAGAAAAGSLTLNGQPSAGDSFTVNGTAVTFVASSPVGNQVVIGASTAATLANLLTFLQQSLVTNISAAVYAQGTGNVITVTDKTAGTAGNSFTLAKSGTNLAVSASTLTGGSQPSTVGYATAPASGTDISALLGLTSGTSQELVSGYASETPVQCASALASASSIWYGLTFAATTSITTAQYLAVCALIEALSVTRMFGATTQDTGALSALVTNDLASLIKAGGYNKSFCHYSSATPYAAASMFGRMFSVDFTAQNSTIELMYKQMPGVTAENLTDAQANALQTKNCNVYVGYDNDTSIIEYGTVGNGNFIDEVWGLDWFQNAIQTSVYNLLFSTTTKIPQTDAGQNQLTNACSAVCGNQPGGAFYNGLSGSGVWNSSTVFGALKTGQYLPLGYYLFAPSVDLQSEADRAARIAPPIQIALKLAGAFQEADVLVTVNR
jgi:hypothetical protein